MECGPGGKVLGSLTGQSNGRTADEGTPEIRRKRTQVERSKVTPEKKGGERATPYDKEVRQMNWRRRREPGQMGAKKEKR